VLVYISFSGRQGIRNRLSMIRMWREESVQYEESVEDINSDAAKATMMMFFEITAQ